MNIHVSPYFVIFTKKTYFNIFFLSLLWSTKLKLGSVHKGKNFLSLKEGENSFLKELIASEKKSESKCDRVAPPESARIHH